MKPKSARQIDIKLKGSEDILFFTHAKISPMLDDVALRLGFWLITPCLLGQMWIVAGKEGKQTRVNWKRREEFRLVKLTKIGWNKIKWEENGNL